MLDSNVYWFEIIKGNNPKEAFEFMVEEIQSWDEFNQTNSFTPKRYHILSNPKTPLSDKDISSYVESIDKKIRANYVACLFLENNRYLFYRKKINAS